MPSLFGVDITGLVGKYIAPGLVDATLHVTAWAARGADSTAGLTRTDANTACKGVLVDYQDQDIDGTLVEDGDRMVLLAASTLAGTVPETGDQITIEGSRYNIVRVKRDPAAATYTCQVRSV